MLSHNHPRKVITQTLAWWTRMNANGHQENLLYIYVYIYIIHIYLIAYTQYWTHTMTYWRQWGKERMQIHTRIHTYISGPRGSLAPAEGSRTHICFYCQACITWRRSTLHAYHHMDTHHCLSIKPWMNKQNTLWKQ